MLKGMMGGALMVALLAGGAFVWAMLGGHDRKMFMEMGINGQMSQHDSMTVADASTDGEGEGVTLAQATAASTEAASTEGHEHTEGMTHDMSGMDMDAGSIPTEPGQGAFAAVSEIVAMLEADPDTDWTTVNIPALSEHLVDMDMLITNAEVTTVDVEHGIEMTISLSGLGGGAASRMVPAHGPVLGGETGWDSTVEMTDTTATWLVVSADNVDQIRALGFFGLMATGDHHRAHHIGMAKGAMVH